MKKMYNNPNYQIKQYNDKILSKLSEYYYLDSDDSIGQLKAINLRITYINEKYHIKIKYLAKDNKIYSRVYPRELLRDKYVFIKVENRKNSYNFKSMKFVVPISKFQKMSDNSLLREIAHSGYIKQIKDKINVDFSVKKKYFYLTKNPNIYPEEYCNMKYTIGDNEYYEKLIENEQKNLEFVKNETGILPNMNLKD